MTLENLNGIAAFIKARTDWSPNPSVQQVNDFPATANNTKNQVFLGYLLLMLLSLCFFTNQCLAQSSATLQSPDGQIKMQLTIGKTQSRPSLQYNVYYQAQQLASGNIRFELGHDQVLDFGSSVKSIQQTAFHKKEKRTIETRGNHNEAKIIKNTYQFLIKSEDGLTDFTLAVNMYNNGVAYKYALPANGKSLTRTTSQVTLPATTTLWWQGDVHTYEANYQKAAFNQLADSLNLGMPLTLQYPNGIYATLSESNIFGFAGSYLTHYKGDNYLNYTLAGPVHSDNKTGLSSGWELITVARDLNGLVNNDILRDVSADPDKQLYPKGLHTDWIQPGKSIWTWMSNKRAVTPENIQRFTDYAASLQIPYNLVDDGWVKWQAPGKDHWQILKEQIDYATNKGVGIWVWQAYPPHNGTPGLKDTAYLRSFLEKCAALGVKGLKIDFINAETQEKIDFYRRAASLAAYYHLMVDFHGANKGTGMEYTYPNLLSQEGVRGLEQKDNQHWPVLNTTLPFTRYLAGPADYTPVSFADYASSTTLAHQVSTAAIFTSPFLCLGADPQDLSQSIALPFIQQLPVTWDETLVLPQSKIGEIAVFARKKGKTWYLAILNGPDAKNITINLSFLGKGKYKLTALQDQTNARNTKIITQDQITKNTAVQLDLQAGGGYLGVFQP